MLHRFKTYENNSFSNTHLKISDDYKDWLNSLKLEDYIASELRRVLEEELGLNITYQNDKLFVIEDKYIINTYPLYNFFKVCIWDKDVYSIPEDVIIPFKDQNPKFTLKEVYSEIKKLKNKQK